MSGSCREATMGGPRADGLLNPELNTKARKDHEKTML
jgi:hypothetical protein